MTRTEILLTGRFVRRLGIALLVSAVVLPALVLYARAAMWRPAPSEEARGALHPEMVILPTGSFLMGSPADEVDRYQDESQHEVRIERQFAISHTEVTQEQFFEVLGRRPVETETDFVGDSCETAGIGDDLPVVCVDWLDAIRYCNELSKRVGLEPAYLVDGEEVTRNEDSTGYRLPTEAEWEYAARAGQQHVWVGTSDVDAVCDFSNVADVSALAANPTWVDMARERGWANFMCNDGLEALAPVSERRPNRWYLHGLGGNSSEWVWDYYDDYPDGVVVDPSGPQRASYRVIRGGSWGSSPQSARVAIRYRSEPSDRGGDLGFRVARSWPSSL